MPARAEVELDIFSGMPNPTWALAEADADSLARRLAALPPPAPSEPSGRLGYRGLVVRTTDATGTRLVRVQSGSVHVANGETAVHLRDEGRELERWLIDTGRPQLPPNVIEIVDRELR
jgi:hypothetical protein